MAQNWYANENPSISKKNFPSIVKQEQIITCPQYRTDRISLAIGPSNYQLLHKFGFGIIALLLFLKLKFDENGKNPTRQKPSGPPIDRSRLVLSFQHPGE